MMIDWSYFLNNWSNIVLAISLIVTAICVIWRFIEERKYPLSYRLFDYLGCFLVFIGPVFGIVIGEWLKVEEMITAGLAMMFLGIGGISTGVSLKLLPVNCDTKVRKKKNWKMCVCVGVFSVLISFLVMFLPD